MKIEELTARLLAARDAAAREIVRTVPIPVSGKVTGPGWDRAANGVCGPVQERIMQGDRVDITTGEVIEEFEGENDLQENFDESLDLLEKALYLLDDIINDKTIRMPAKLLMDIKDKRLDLWEFLDDYRQIEDDPTEDDDAREDRVTALVQSRDEFIRQLEADDEAPFGGL